MNLRPSPKGSRLFASFLICSLGGCSNEQVLDQRDPAAYADADALPEQKSRIDASNIEQVSLARSPSESVSETFVLTFDSQANGFQLQSDQEPGLHWRVEDQADVAVNAEIKADKYLRVTNLLNPVITSDNGDHSLGCLLIELKDNVNFEEQGWLRLATTGIVGQRFVNVQLGLSAQRGDDWLEVPIIEQDSLSLARFETQTVKTYNGEVCFQLDTRNAPSQSYSGQIIVQYLIGDTPTSGLNELDLNTPSADQFQCESTPSILSAGQSVALRWNQDISSSQIRLYGLTKTNTTDDDIIADDDIDYGNFDIDDDGSLIYTAPDDIDTETKVFVSTQPIDQNLNPSFCEVTLIADDHFAADDDGESEGWVGNVFALSNDTKWLPDFDQMTPISRVMLPNLAIPERQFSAGFPGVNDLFEWFGIRFDSLLVLPESCDCEFQLIADDGAILYIDGEEVINNDGVHPTRSKSGAASLSAGYHDIRVDYFQGPRYHITLELRWRPRDIGDFKVINADFFQRP